VCLVAADESNPAMQGSERLKVQQASGPMAKNIHQNWTGLLVVSRTGHPTGIRHFWIDYTHDMILNW